MLTAVSATSTVATAYCLVSPSTLAECWMIELYRCSRCSPSSHCHHRHLHNPGACSSWLGGLRCSRVWFQVSSLPE